MQQLRGGNGETRESIRPCAQNRISIALQESAVHCAVVCPDVWRASCTVPGTTGWGETKVYSTTWGLTEDVAVGDATSGTVSVRRASILFREAATASGEATDSAAAVIASAVAAADAAASVAALAAVAAASVVVAAAVAECPRRSSARAR